MDMTKKASQQKVPLRSRGFAAFQPERAQENLLKRFEPQLHGEEVMAWRPVGVEVLP